MSINCSNSRNLNKKISYPLDEGMVLFKKLDKERKIMADYNALDSKRAPNIVKYTSDKKYCIRLEYSENKNNVVYGVYDNLNPIEYGTHNPKIRGTLKNCEHYLTGGLPIQEQYKSEDILDYNGK